MRTLKGQFGIAKKDAESIKPYNEAYQSDDDTDEAKYPLTKITSTSNQKSENVIYMCTLCHAKLKTFKSLQRHVENMHIGWKSFLANRNKSTDNEEEIRQREREAVKRKKHIKSNIPYKRQKLSNDYSVKRKKLESYINLKKNYFIYFKYLIK